MIGLTNSNGASASSPLATAATEAMEFVNEFESEYGERHPMFVNEGFMDALQRSRREFKLLFVYLHSPDHPDTPAFCEGSLCDDVLCEFVNENFVAWGGSITSSEGFKMSNSLKASRFPFCAVVMAAANQRIALLQQLEGPKSPEEMLTILQRVLEESAPVLVTARLDAEERINNMRLREEQDAAYQAALEADQVCPDLLRSNPIITSEPQSNSSQLNPPSRIICRVCQKQFSQYTCPRCNTRYCSLPCYKSHSLRCTESFMRDNVMGEMQRLEPGDETKQKMLDILKRFHSEEEHDDGVDDDGFADSVLSEETVQKIMSGVQISFEDLTTEEKKHFQRAVASGELSKLIEPWEPWWLKPAASTISLSAQGTQRVQPLTKQENNQSDHTHEVPKGPETALPSVSKLTSTEPSPLLAVHLVDILYSYCFTLRLYNGDWESDPVGSASVVLSISLVLGQGGQPETVSEAMSYCLEQTCSPAFRHMGGLKFGLGVLDDVTSLFSLGGDALVCGLCDLHRMMSVALREVKMEKRREIKGKLKSGERKVYFLMCWVHEQPHVAWSSLAGLVMTEKNAAMEYIGNGTGGWRDNKKAERKGKVIIEEIL